MTILDVNKGKLIVAHAQTYTILHSFTGGADGGMHMPA